MLALQFYMGDGAGRGGMALELDWFYNGFIFFILEFIMYGV